jgi:hypothetical protein
MLVSSELAQRPTRAASRTADDWTTVGGGAAALVEEVCVDRLRACAVERLELTSDDDDWVPPPPTHPPASPTHHRDGGGVWPDSMLAWYPRGPQVREMKELKKWQKWIDADDKETKSVEGRLAAEEDAAEKDSAAEL